MTIFVRRNGRLVNKQTGEAMLKSGSHGEIKMPFVQSDLPDYFSPLGTGLISGRAARREDLKRHGCREVDPTEFAPDYLSARFERRYSKRAPKTISTCQS